MGKCTKAENVKFRTFILHVPTANTDNIFLQALRKFEFVTLGSFKRQCSPEIYCKKIKAPGDQRVHVVVKRNARTGVKAVCKVYSSRT